MARLDRLTSVVYWLSFVLTALLAGATIGLLLQASWLEAVVAALIGLIWLWNWRAAADLREKARRRHEFDRQLQAHDEMVARLRADYERRRHEP